MPYKTKEEIIKYYKKYYQEHKKEYADRERLKYWRKKALSLGESNAVIIKLTIDELKKLCGEHLN